jgi:hypothetical protein
MGHPPANNRDDATRHLKTAEDRERRFRIALIGRQRKPRNATPAHNLAVIHMGAAECGKDTDYVASMLHAAAATQRQPLKLLAKILQHTRHRSGQNST